MSRYKLLFLLWVLLLAGNASAQDSIQTPYLDISKIPLTLSLSDKEFSSSYIEPHQSLTEKYNTLTFKKGLSHKGFIPNTHVTKKSIIRFNAYNSADTAVGMWFFPRIYFWDIQLYKETGNQLEKLASIQPGNEDGISYRYFSLAPHDSATIVAELRGVKTYLNKPGPRLISKEYLDAFIAQFHASNNETNLISYVFCGLLLMMIIYSFSNYFQGRNKEFLYYSGYAFLFGLLLFTKAMFSFHTTWMAFFQEEYLDFVMQSLGYLFYMLFMQKFLATKMRHPFLHKLYNSGIAILALSVVGYTFFHYFTDNFVTENNIENITKIVLLVMVIIFLLYSIRHWNDKLLRYLFWGNLCLFAFSLVSQMIIMANHMTRNFPSLLRTSLLYYEIGLFLELVFFLAGLNYKNRKRLVAQASERERLKAENQMKEYEKEIAVFKAQQEERERISADMHDELGSGMTAIRLMSEIARNKMKGDTPIEIEKISNSADEVLNKMNAIIWSMNSDNDSVDNLISYIRSYALEYFDSTPIDCKVTTPDKIEDKEITGDKRRNLFLCVKETLNNALKHSKAAEIKISFIINQALVIQIADNGVGIDLENIRKFGNGLKNINKRMESIGGSYKIENKNGTVTTLTLPL
ncbi:MAG: sensor histidine kinase [Chitinophagaceae bacterium]